MKVIRKSVFETNSSSCHSLSIERSVNDLWNRQDMLYFLLNEESYIENVGND